MLLFFTTHCPIHEIMSIVRTTAFRPVPVVCWWCEYFPHNLYYCLLRLVISFVDLYMCGSSLLCQQHTDCVREAKVLHTTSARLCRQWLIPKDIGVLMQYQEPYQHRQVLWQFKMGIIFSNLPMCLMLRTSFTQNINCFPRLTVTESQSANSVTLQVLFHSTFNQRIKPTCVLPWIDCMFPVFHAMSDCVCTCMLMSLCGCYCCVCMCVCIKSQKSGQLQHCMCVCMRMHMCGCVCIHGHAMCCVCVCMHAWVHLHSRIYVIL